MEMISVALKPGGERRTPGEEGSPPTTKGTGIRKTPGSIRRLLPSMQMRGAVVCKDLLAAPAGLCGDGKFVGQHPVPPAPPAPRKDKAQRKFCWKCSYMGGCDCSSQKVRLGVPPRYRSWGLACFREVPEALWYCARAVLDVAIPHHFQARALLFSAPAASGDVGTVRADASSRADGNRHQQLRTHG